MKLKIKEILTDIFIQRLVKVFIVIFFLYFVIIIWKWEKIPPQIPLFYSLPEGVEQLASRVFVFIFPIISLFFFIIDLLLASYLYRQEKLAANILVILGSIISVLFFIAFIKIVFLIT